MLDQMKWEDGDKVLNLRWINTKANYSKYNFKTDRNLQHSNSDILASGQKPQPEYGLDCSLALYNSFTDRLELAAISCSKSIHVSQLICVVGNSQQPSWKTFIAHPLYGKFLFR